MSFFNTIENFVSDEWKKITGEADVIEAKLESAATLANNAVNSLKTWVDSPQGQRIDAVITSIPGIGAYAADILKFLPVLVQGLGWAKSEFTKSPRDIVEEGITTAVAAIDPDIKASNLITLQGHLNTLISGLQGTPQPIQTTMSIAPAVYAASKTPAGVVESPISGTAVQAEYNGL